MTSIRLALALVFTLFCACQVSTPGGNPGTDEGFKIIVPLFNIQIKQGQIQTMSVSLQRDSLFKQDVRLQVSASKGITINPMSITIKAGDKPDVQFEIAAPQDAAIGEYPVVIMGTPKTGDPTSVGFSVVVSSP